MLLLELMMPLRCHWSRNWLRTGTNERLSCDNAAATELAAESLTVPTCTGTGRSMFRGSGGQDDEATCNSLSSRWQASMTRNATGANASSEWSTTREESLFGTQATGLATRKARVNGLASYMTMRFLKSGQSSVKVSYSPPSPQTFIWNLSFCNTDRQEQ